MSTRNSAAKLSKRDDWQICECTLSIKFELGIADLACAKLPLQRTENNSRAETDQHAGKMDAFLLTALSMTISTAALLLV